ncbi:MAG TPA: TIGR04222 domain-containing membrane protein [Thermoanaerobaculia bacterium]|nr:TIGR04222 domain-containing membrane protein [Thermoanaerobaculia bacterium]
MNPLDLTGPEFLGFYLPYGLCILALAWLVRALLYRSMSSPPDERRTPGTYPLEDDAYAIAFLRGGAPEAVRTVLGRLVGAEMLRVKDNQVRALGDPQSQAAQLEPIESTAWSAFTPGVSYRAVEAEQGVSGAISTHLREIEEELARQGLLPTHAWRSAFRALSALAGLAVLGLGLAKLLVAFSRGKSNVGFLILLLIGFGIAVIRLLPVPRQTRAGRRYLDWLQESHRGLFQMFTSGRRGGAGEMALAAGIYGLAAVPDLIPLGAAFQPVRPVRGDSGSSSCGSGGSSCSSGSSCGGGCGGGGCGGCGG